VWSVKRREHVMIVLKHNNKASAYLADEEWSVCGCHAGGEGVLVAEWHQQ
jgi:hypothetical protein